MRRECARFGCNAAAAATFTFDTTTLTVWLDTPAEGAARAGELCSRHAGSLRPPRGWHLEDRRAPVVVTVPVPAAVVPAGTAPGQPAPAGGAGTDVAGLLDARSPLLARAFRSAGRV